MASGPEIRAARKAAGLKIHHVASALGVDKSTIIRIEKGSVHRSRFQDEVERCVGLAPTDAPPTAVSDAIQELHLIRTALHQVGATLVALAGRLDQVLARLAKPE